MINLHINGTNIDNQLKQFWELEEIPNVKDKLLTSEEQFVETHFQNTYACNSDGRFVVKLPFYKSNSELGDSKPAAISRLLAMERKFKNNPDFEKQYKEFMNEYESLGHMSLVNSRFHTSKDQNFLPHHAVIKPSSPTTKLRVVFDASCKTTNASASFLATRCIKQIALDDKDNPNLSRVLQEDIYMDDLLSGADTPNNAISICKDIAHVLSTRGFHLRKWNSNSIEFLAQFSEHSSHDARVEFSKDSNESSKVLGLFWNSSNDTFGFQPSLELTPPLTKRLLSWLSGHPRQWKTFVANRTSEVIEVLPTKHWRHVPSKENPADIASRGIDPKSLPDCKLWWQGPPWLRLETSSWPKAESSCDEASDEVKAEQKSVSIFNLFTHTSNDVIHGFIRTLLFTHQNEHGLVRVGGRLQNSQLRFNSKHPIILPSQHSVSELLIKEQHIAHLHAGPTLLAHVLRQSHWIVGTTKAVHIEAVGDLTTDSFIAALRRFSARRGAPRHIYSDNGTNFVGARRKLDEIRKLWLSLPTNEAISYYLSKSSIDWHFIPPSSPHFELTTLLTQIEGLLNSRPLSYVNDSDIECISTLTPSHFLTGDVLLSVPEELPSTSNHRDRWELLQNIKRGFWKKWSSEFISSLQPRKKWQDAQRNLKEDDIVLIKEEGPPGTWPMARVLQVHPGNDGLVRVATVKTKTQCLNDLFINFH
ncbi:integrase catalytic domain-containing protein [Trichonephila clavipes]|nr:integrase catalytic domain-containing protein [Trichonephila clavipes]